MIPKDYIDYDDNDPQALRREIKSLQKVSYILANAIETANQCIIKWEWNKPISTPWGLETKELDEFVQIVLQQGYKIVSLAVTEYTETGHALHAIIITIAPENGKLHE